MHLKYNGNIMSPKKKDEHSRLRTSFFFVQQGAVHKFRDDVTRERVNSDFLGRYASIMEFSKDSINLHTFGQCITR